MAHRCPSFPCWLDSLRLRTTDLARFQCWARVFASFSTSGTLLSATCRRGSAGGSHQAATKPVVLKSSVETHSASQEKAQVRQALRLSHEGVACYPGRSSSGTDNASSWSLTSKTSDLANRLDGSSASERGLFDTTDYGKSSVFY